MTLEETYYEINQILGDNTEPLESVRTPTKSPSSGITI